jgi:hypothetical protein
VDSYRHKQLQNVMESNEIASRPCGRASQIASHMLAFVTHLQFVVISCVKLQEDIKMAVLGRFRPVGAQ